MARRHPFKHDINFKSQTTRQQTSEGELVESSVNVIAEGQRLRSRKGTRLINHSNGSNNTLFTEFKGTPLSIHRDTNTVINLSTQSTGPLYEYGTVPPLSTSHSIQYADKTYIIADNITWNQAGVDVINKPTDGSPDLPEISTIEPHEFKFSNTQPWNFYDSTTYATNHESEFIGTPFEFPDVVAFEKANNGDWTTFHKAFCFSVQFSTYINLKATEGSKKYFTLLPRYVGNNTWELTHWKNLTQPHPGHPAVLIHEVLPSFQTALLQLLQEVGAPNPGESSPQTALTNTYNRNYTILNIHPGLVTLKEVSTTDYGNIQYSHNGDTFYAYTTNYVPQTYKIDIPSGGGAFGQNYKSFCNNSVSYLKTHAGTGTMTDLVAPVGLPPYAGHNTLVGGLSGGQPRWYRNTAGSCAIPAVWVEQPYIVGANATMAGVGLLENGNTIKWASETNVIFQPFTGADPLWNGVKVLQTGIFAGRAFIATEKGVSFSKAGDPTQWNIEVDSQGILYSSSAFDIEMPINPETYEPITLLEGSMIIRGSDTFRLTIPNIFSATSYNLSPLPLDSVSNIVAVGSHLVWLARNGIDVYLRIAANTIQEHSMQYSELTNVAFKGESGINYTLFTDVASEVRIFNDTSEVWVARFLSEINQAPRLSRRVYSHIHSAKNYGTISSGYNSSSRQDTYVAQQGQVISVVGAMPSFTAALAADNITIETLTALITTERLVWVRKDTGETGVGSPPLNTVVAYGYIYDCWAGIENIGANSNNSTYRDTKHLNAIECHLSNDTSALQIMLREGGEHPGFSESQDKNWGFSRFEEKTKIPNMTSMRHPHYNMITAKISRRMNQHTRTYFMTHNGLAFDITRATVHGTS